MNHGLSLCHLCLTELSPAAGLVLTASIYLPGDSRESEGVFSVYTTAAAAAQQQQLVRVDK